MGGWEVVSILVGEDVDGFYRGGSTGGDVDLDGAIVEFGGRLYFGGAIAEHHFCTAVGGTAVPRRVDHADGVVVLRGISLLATAFPGKTMMMLRPLPGRGSLSWRAVGGEAGPRWLISAQLGGGGHVAPS
mmetsp:Transcript_30908/g.64601  ORF Transcript_30908/g.64601 Transcript_30908/m.64601 type:complete len:130 (-) Transcript_30908:240-629(-)